VRSAIIAVPADCAADLERQGLAAQPPALRGPVLDAVVTVGTDASVLVTLLTAPDAIRSFATWVRGRSARSGDTIEVIACRGGKRVSLTVTGDVGMDVVTRFLSDAFEDDGQ
jgi:hypothetical protein